MSRLPRTVFDFLLDAAGLGLLTVVAVLLLGGALSELPRPLVAGVLLGGGLGLAQMLGRAEEDPPAA